MGRCDCALRPGGQAEARLRGGLLVSRHGLLHARQSHAMPRRVPARDSARAEERRGLRVSGAVRVRVEGVRPVAPGPAPVAHARGRRCARARWDRPLSRGAAHDARGTVRAGPRDARRVCCRRQRQPARDRGDGPRHVADGSPADRGTADAARDGADGRPRQLSDGHPEHRGRGASVSGTGGSLSRDAERALRLRRIPSAGTAGQGDRGIQARARAATRSRLDADADCLRIREPRRRASRRSPGPSRPSPRRQTRLPRERRSGRRCSTPGTSKGQSRSSSSASSSRQRVPACTSRWRAPISVPGAWTMPRASAPNSRGSIGWPARSGAVRSPWGENDRVASAARRCRSHPAGDSCRVGAATTARTAGTAARRRRQRGSPGRARGCGHPRPARPAGPGPVAGGLRTARRRRAAEARVVHASLR